MCIFCVCDRRLICLSAFVFACVYPQHVRNNKSFDTALVYLSSESLLDEVAVTEDWGGAPAR